MSVLDVHEALFDVVAAADLVFWPIALDTKYNDVEAMPDGHIDLTLFNGAIRNSENRHMANVLRQKSKILVAYGSCAHMGGIPGLANFSTKQELLNRVYHESESTSNPEKKIPETAVEKDEGVLVLPSFFEDVQALSDVVDVDFYIAIRFSGADQVIPSRCVLRTDVDADCWAVEPKLSRADVSEPTVIKIQYVVE